MTTFRVYKNGRFYYFHMGQIMSPFSQENYDKFCLDGLDFDQWTGLFDKNEEKIFVGDLLKEDSQRGNRYQVFAVDGGFAVNTHPDDFNKEVIMFYESTADMQMSGYIEGSCEIIGNIYENPELLT